jgi:hypothetical protein
MVTIHGCDESPEVEFAATSAEYALLAESVAELIVSDATEAFVEAVASDPSPYGRSLSGLRVSKAAGALSVTITGATLSISGAAPALVLFVDCLPVESGLPPRYHIHFECVGREELVAPNSIPLILMVAGSSDV